MIGNTEFLNLECLNKFITLSSSKPLPVHLVDHDEYGDGYDLESLFEFQNLLSFLTPKYQSFYPRVVIEFYANLILLEDDNVLSCRSMVSGHAFDFNENSISKFLIGKNEPFDPKGLIDLFHTKAPLRIGSYKRQPHLQKDELIHTMMNYGAKFKAKMGTLYASNLTELPHLLSLIVAYNLYPHKNHIEMTTKTRYIIYCLINKVPIHWGQFIEHEMLNLRGYLPYASLICELMDTIPPHNLSQLKYKKGQAGYTITDSMIVMMGKPITPQKKAEAGLSKEVLSFEPVQDPKGKHHSSGSNFDTFDDYSRLVEQMSSWDTHLTELRKEHNELARFQYQIAYAIQNDFDTLFKAQNI